MAKDYPWNEVKNEYIVLTSEGKTKVLDILAEKHNIPYNTLNARVQRDGWREYANKLEAKSADKLIDKVTAAKLKHIQIGNELIDIGMKTRCRIILQKRSITIRVILTVSPAKNTGSITAAMILH